MKQVFLRFSAIIALCGLLYTGSSAQERKEVTIEKNDTYKTDDNNDEIIIRRKGDKDTRITLEIRKDTILINGKPLDQFDEDGLSIMRKSIITGDDDGNVFIAPMPPSPFRGSWGHAGNSANSKKTTAFLGVATEKSEAGGVAVNEVTKGSAAEKAGLKKGDIITKIDDTKIDEPSDLVETIHGYQPDKKVTVTYKRNGKEQKAAVTLGKTTVSSVKTYSFSMPGGAYSYKWNEMPAPPAMPKGYNYNYDFFYNERESKIGIKAQDTEDGKGVKVLDVDEESSAEKAGIREGDIITQFDGQEVNNAETLARLARSAKAKISVKVKLTRDGKSQEMDIRMPRKLKTMDL